MNKELLSRLEKIEQEEHEQLIIFTSSGTGQASFWWQTETVTIDYVDTADLQKQIHKLTGLDDKDYILIIFEQEEN